MIGCERNRPAKGWAVRRTTAAWAVALLLAPAAADLARAQGQVASKVQDASALLTKGDAAGALAMYGEALSDPGLTNDRRSAILTDRGVVYSRLNQPRQAIEDFNRAIQLFPENPAVYNNRGSTLLALGLAQEAVKDFDRAIALAPGYAASYNNRAAAYTRLGMPIEAIRDYTKAIELAPQNPAPLGGRGRAHLAHQRPHAALRDFNRAINADGRFAAGYRARAEAKLAIQRYDEAAEDLSRAAAFDAVNPEVLLLRGRAYLLAGNYAGAIKDFSRAIEFEPGRARAYEFRGYAHARAEAHDLADADLARALELEPRSALAYAYRAWLFKQTGRAELAAREIEKAAKIEADRAEVLWVRAEIAEALGRPQEAIGHLSRALVADPGLKEAVDALDRLGGRSGQDETEVDGGLDPWRVVKQSGRFFAVSRQHPRLRVPLEMMGPGQPRLLEFDIRPPPFVGIALLRFDAGKVNGAESAEQVAILDLQAGAIVGIQPHRQGDRIAAWQWNEGRVVVASVDGVSDEFVLRQAPRPAPVADPRRLATGAGTQPKYGLPEWAPWATPNNYPRQAPAPGYGASGGGQKKPKTLFDMLLGN
jgi:tetratricopeptide (TPR) repeat protein